MLNAVLCVWNEEDIIESTVAHAFAQGCDNVYLIDNGSTDKTVELATNSGALLACEFTSKYFDEVKKVLHINGVVEIYNNIVQDEQVWWLFLDADEFPDTNTSMTLADYVRTLDPAYGAVSGHLVDHLPTHKPYHRPGFHPADFMPLCAETATRKIVLLRYTKGQPHIFIEGGAHCFSDPGYALPVMEDAIHIHHFQQRSVDHTVRRLQALLQKKADGTSRVDWMDTYARDYQNKSQSMYHDRMAALSSLYATHDTMHMYTRTLPYAYTTLKRWYNPALIATYSNGDDFDIKMAVGQHMYFMAQYDEAICLFNEARELASGRNSLVHSTIKLAECFVLIGDTVGTELLQRIRPIAGSRERAYIDSLLADTDEGSA